MINDGDKVIRDHIGSMEAGSENIVFDKEAAWGRLHERMAAKPPETVFKLPYRWAAAAAILLLIATVIAVMNRPEEKHVATIVRKAAPVSLPQTKNIAPGNDETVTALPNAPVHEHTAQKETRIINNIATPAPEALVLKEEVANIIPKEKKEVIAATPKMKVVHINELAETERVERMEYNTRYATGRSSFFLFKSTSQTGLLEDNDNTDYQTHRLFKPRFSQN